jgi:hypothetical protein
MAGVYFFRNEILRVGAKANVLHTKIKNKIIDAALLLLQKDSKHGYAEKAVG